MPETTATPRGGGPLRLRPDQARREDADHGRECGHEDRAEADATGLEHGVCGIAALGDALVGELDQEDRVLRHQAQQQDDPDETVDIQRHGGDFRQVGGEPGDGLGQLIERRVELMRANWLMTPQQPDATGTRRAGLRAARA